MKKSIILHPGMGEAVVNHLRQFGDVPNTGILAGQAVDSAITDLFGAGGGVYNDLDIFRVETSPLQNRNRLTANSLTKRSEVGVAPSQHGYENLNVLMSVVSTYNIHSVNREDMLNTVNCIPSWPCTGLTAEQVISGFDINCTRVAVDLTNNRLVWDRDYEQFLRSRQLRIAMMHTPWHTFLRLMKKAQELPGVYVDKEVAAEACVAVARSQFLEHMLKTSDVSMSFGKKNLELAHRLESEWSPYFELGSKTLYLGRNNKWLEDQKDPVASGKSTELWYMRPRGELNSALQDKCDRMGTGLLFFGAKLIENSRRQVAPAAYDKLNAIVEQQRKTLAGEVDCTMGPHQPVNLSKAMHDNFGAHFIQTNAELLGTDYVQGQALPTMAAKLAEWLRQHKALALGMVGMTLDEQYRYMQAVNEVCRKCGKLYFNGDSQVGIGVLEGKVRSQVFRTAEEMEAILVDYYQKNHSPFEVEPLPLPAVLPARFAGFAVSELLSPLALRNEGTSMGHCVGGYADHVRSNRSRILAIRYMDERRSPDCSTVELKGKFADKPEAWGVTVNQNYTAGNKHPTARNKELVEYLQGYFAMMKVVDKCQGSTPKRTARLLNEEARGCESKAKRLIHEISRLTKQHNRLLQTFDARTVTDEASDYLKRNAARNMCRRIDQARTDVTRQLAELKKGAKFLRELATLQGPTAKTHQLVQDALVSRSRTNVLEPMTEPAQDDFQAAA